MHKIIFFSFIALLVLSCKEKEQAPAQPPVKIRIVHASELSSLMASIKNGFIQSNFKLSGGVAIEPEFITESDLNAARKLASGDLKVEGWISSSTSLVNYANTNRRNLGAAQVACRPLYSSPIVVAARSEDLHVFDEKERIFSWREFFRRVSGPVKTEQQSLAWSFGIARLDSASTGVPALLQLMYLALANVEEAVTLKHLQDTSFVSVFKAYLANLTFYPESDTSLLDRVAGQRGTRIVFAFSSEHDVARYNSNRGGVSPTLVALYPTEGLYWQDYSFCLSDADWVTAAQRAAVTSFADYFAEKSVQELLLSSGYRPAGVALEQPQGILSPQNGVSIEATKGSRLPVSAEVSSYLIDKSREYTRPVATTFILDSSGTTIGSVSSAGSKFVRMIAARAAKRDLTALVTFSDKAQLVSDFTNDPANIIKPLEKIQASGGSAIYEAISLAVKMNTADKLKDYRKNILLFTDGKDNKSQISLEDLLDLLKDIKRQHDINIYVYAVQAAGVDLTDLQNITSVVDGEFKKISPLEVDKVIEHSGTSQW